MVPVGSSGVQVTRLVFGGAPIGGLFAPVDDDAAQATLEAAWDAGIRAFDTAPHYGVGLSERRIGRFLAGRPRGDYVLSTKVGRLLESADGDVDGAEGYFGTPQAGPGSRLFTRRRARIPGGKPRAARSRPDRHRADPRPGRPRARGARRRVPGPRRTARRGRHRRGRRRHEPGRDAGVVPAPRRPRLRARGRPVHAAGHPRGGLAVSRVPAPRGGRARRGGVQQRRARRPSAPERLTTICPPPPTSWTGRGGSARPARGTGCRSERPRCGSRCATLR